MTKDNFIKTLEEKTHLTIDIYDFYYQKDNTVTVFQNHNIDKYNSRNGLAYLNETYFIYRKIIKQFGEKDKKVKKNMWFGYMGYLG